MFKHKELLKKYIHLILLLKSEDYLDSVQIHAPGLFREDELVILRGIAKQARDERFP